MIFTLLCTTFYTLVVPLYGYEGVIFLKVVEGLESHRRTFQLSQTFRNAFIALINIKWALLLPLKKRTAFSKAGYNC